MPAAARVGDMVRQDSPHCHAPIHPPAPVPTPSAHPALPIKLKLRHMVASGADEWAWDGNSTFQIPTV